MIEPSTTSQWLIDQESGHDFEALQLQDQVQLPKLGPHDCLLKIEAVSLNYRDVGVLRGNYPFGVKKGVIPVSDGAGTVVSVGSQVTGLKIGDRACTLFHQGWQKGPLTPAIRETTLGTNRDGVLRKYAVFPEEGLVPAPEYLSAREASSLPCAAVTAWNALYGLDGRSLTPEHTVLVQGTGGVSLFAVQFAKAAGARVIATTSSDEKAAKLKKFGVDHIINYTVDKQWGETAKNLSPDGAGVDHIIEVGGNATIQQSLKAIRIEGVISIVGFLGGLGQSSSSNFGEVLSSLSILRGVNVGSKDQFQAMNDFMERHRIRPVVDSATFAFEEAKTAYQYLWDRKNWGKVVIDVDSSRS